MEHSLDPLCIHVDLDSYSLAGALHEIAPVIESLPDPQIPAHPILTLTQPGLNSGTGISSIRRSLFPCHRRARITNTCVREETLRGRNELSYCDNLCDRKLKNLYRKTWQYPMNANGTSSWPNCTYAELHMSASAASRGHPRVCPAKTRPVDFHQALGSRRLHPFTQLNSFLSSALAMPISRHLG